MKVIGLTGGIASGKSTASRYLAQNGLPVLDADVMAREIVQPGMPALKEIVEAFGEDMLLITGELDRKALGRLVFSDPEALKKLNAITHPKIRERLLKHLESIEDMKSYPAVIIDAALLMETGWHELVDDVWLIVIDENHQKRRLIERNAITELEAQTMMAIQMPMADKMKLARVWIDNNGLPSDLYHQLDELVMTIM